MELGGAISPKEGLNILLYDYFTQNVPKLTLQEDKSDLWVPGLNWY